MEVLGPKPTDAALDRMREALTGHEAKPFYVVNSQTGRPLNWFDDEQNAIQAARFAAKAGTAYVVYRAIVLVEPVKGNIALLTYAPPADASSG